MKSLLLIVALCGVAMAASMPKLNIRGSPGGHKHDLRMICLELAHNMESSKRAEILDDLVVRWCREILREIGVWTRPPRTSPAPTTAPPVPTTDLTDAVTTAPMPTTSATVVTMMKRRRKPPHRPPMTTAGPAPSTTPGMSTNAGPSIMTYGAGSMKKRQMTTALPGTAGVPTTGGVTSSPPPPPPSTTDDDDDDDDDHRCGGEGGPVAMMEEICHEMSENLDRCMSHVHLDIYQSLMAECMAQLYELRAKMEK